MSQNQKTIKHIPVTHFFDLPENPPKDILDVFIKSIDELLKNEKVLDNNFTFIAPINFLESRLPKNAIKLVNALLGTSLREWLYITDKFRITFLGTDRVDQAYLVYIREQEVDNNESKSESTK